VCNQGDKTACTFYILVVFEGIDPVAMLQKSARKTNRMIQDVNSSH